MKQEKGITLTSLVIYIIAMLIVITIMSSVSLMFYRNTEQLSTNTEDILEYSNFNHYFINEIKSANNEVDRISNDGSYILFASGNSFSFKNNSIYFNTIEVAKNVQSATFSQPDSNHKEIVKVKVVLNGYENEMNYKIEEIY